MSTDEDGGAWDVIVIGGGAAGIFAATAAAEHGARTLLLERNRRVGVKVLASGGTRCNVTSVLPVHEMARWFGKKGGRFLGHALKALPPSRIVALLHEEGVETYEEKWDKVFPRSNRATDVLSAFVRRMDRAGARSRCDARVGEVRKAEDGTFETALESGGEALTAKRVILACGGRSYPKTGTTGDGYAIAASLGHSIVPPRPALVPLLSNDPWVRESTGIAFQDVAVELRDAAGKVLATRRRPLLFTHFGVSGPAAMDVSREATAREGSEDAVTLVVDFVPERGSDTIAAGLEAAIVAEPGKSLLHALPPECGWPERFAERLLATRGVDAKKRAGGSSKADRRAIVDAIKATPIAISGNRGFDFAEVTAGGVDLDEVNPRTMESRMCPGFFVCGEVLDVDGPIGGFNFQSAFATGHVAGESAALSLTR